MTRYVKDRLQWYARYCQRILSSKALNPRNKEGLDFSLESVRPFSEDSAAAVYRKSDNQKFALFLFYNAEQISNIEDCPYNGTKGTWWRLPATSGHVTGMLLFAQVYADVERFNFELTHGYKA